MASVKILKKELNLLTEELISECVFRLDVLKNTNPEELVSIIDELIVLRDETLSKIQKPKKEKDPKKVKEVFAEVKKSYLESLNQIIDRLNKIK